MQTIDELEEQISLVLSNGYEIITDEDGRVIIETNFRSEGGELIPLNEEIEDDNDFIGNENDWEDIVDNMD